ncbi:hypothetical protein [Cognatishimia sp. F0-27]|uniref:hypothetical protein n=1 Tax=Cognatishimia sp. F0-27 TaxID=2816855 RepID=UPI001D0C674A|nr:hypothetical protein [Cognatishimia sp. F0-27]MCC1493577.1 hypothetical protein [Cognatishimia sp. F0-27]
MVRNSLYSLAAAITFVATPGLSQSMAVETIDVSVDLEAAAPTAFYPGLESDVSDALVLRLRPQIDDEGIEMQVIITSLDLPERPSEIDASTTSRLSAEIRYRDTEGRGRLHGYKKTFVIAPLDSAETAPLTPAQAASLKNETYARLVNALADDAVANMPVDVPVATLRGGQDLPG